MINSRASVRYAKALFEAAVESNKVETVSKDMMQIAQTVEGSIELKQMLQNTTVSSTVIKIYLDKIFSDSSSLVKSLIDVLATNKRLLLIAQIANEYERKCQALNDTKKVTVISAVALNESSQKAIITNLEKQGLKNISLENTVDPSILGGFVLKFDDNQFDASIKNKLTRIKREFSKSL
ncbi:MAG: ATP synthase F1 subunit delta [Flavobacteriaceae bacterium]|nr:ATP synthase F1 subunit delta [Flavobacteriaceae bacterium]